MPAVAPVRRTAARLAALLVAALALGVAAAPVDPAVAAPPTGLLPAAPGTDDEGGTAELRAQLDAASKGWLDAKTALARSVKRQQQLTAQLKTTEAELTVRSARVGEIAGLAYRTGRLTATSALLNSATPQGFMDRAAALDQVAANEDRALRDLTEARDQANRTRTALGVEIQEQRKQVAVMGKRKQQAERALEVANDRASSSGTAPRGTSTANADPAPRNPDGSWPPESCSVNDPTPADGCITPRMLHALQEAQAAGFKRYVSCYRPSGSGEHPKGRACDFAAQTDGFGGVATGGDKTYGDNLAAYFVRNADPLAVLYVIWYKQIWLPSSGWKAYSGGNGDPSSDHTNHVHLSVY